MRTFFLSFLIFCLAAPALGAFYPERRRGQFQHEPGHILVPYVFNLPGIGSGYAVLGALTNVNGTTTDLSATVFGGDVVGGAAAVDAVHLIPERLIFDAGGAYLSRAAMQFYSERGMNTEKDDYSLAEFQDSFYGGTRVTLTFDERRWEAYLGYYGGSTKLAAMRDNKGKLILKSSDSKRDLFDAYAFGLRADLTDDYSDPRAGIRADASNWWAPPEGDAPEGYQLNLNLTGYVPIGKRSTIALNYFHSDAVVVKKGETDPDKIAADAGLDCDSLSDPILAAECRNYIINKVAGNGKGGATSLGGYGRLRSYPEGRYRGAHTRFIGSELRWNLTDENTPFDIYVVKDIRTSFQIALFYEIGTVTDNPANLWNTTRSTYGAGLRIVTASGVVYRVDLADGDEGFQPSIFFQYPWEL